MSRSYWLPVIAAIGLTLWGAQAGPTGHHQGRDAQAKHSSESPRQNVGQAEVPAIEYDLRRIARVLETKDAEDNSASEQNDRRSNLEAQERMATFAGLMFAVGLVELGITLFGVVLLRRTLKETRRIGQAQVRAYVSIKDVIVYTFTPGLCPRIQFCIVNSGQSPARRFVWALSLRYFAGSGETPKRYTDTGDWRSGYGRDIAAGDSDTQSMILPDMSVTEYISGLNSPRAFISGQVRVDFQYLDVFDRVISDYVLFAGIITTDEWQGDAPEASPPNIRGRNPFFSLDIPDTEEGN